MGLVEQITQMGGVYISVLEHCRKRKFRTFLHLTLISKNFMMSRFSGFVVCSTNLYIWSNGVSGADNSNNSSNPDTSMKFGKKHPYVILFPNQS